MIFLRFHNCLNITIVVYDTTINYENKDCFITLQWSMYDIKKFYGIIINYETTIVVYDIPNDCDITMVDL